MRELEFGEKYEKGEIATLEDKEYQVLGRESEDDWCAGCSLQEKHENGNLCVIGACAEGWCSRMIGHNIWKEVTNVAF